MSKTGNESEFHGLYKHKRPNQILLSNACFYKVGLLQKTITTSKNLTQVNLYCQNVDNI